MELRTKQKQYRFHLYILFIGGIISGLGLALLHVSGKYTNAQNTISSLRAEVAELSSRPTCVVQTPWQANTTKQFFIESSGGQRIYNVHLPHNFSAEATYPVIIALDGKGGYASNIEAYSQFDELPVISVYPEPLVGTDGYTSWQSAPYSPTGVSDVVFMQDMLTALGRDMCVDPAQIYVVGMSNGGGLAWLLSCYIPDRISAIAIVSGALYTDCNTSALHTPIIAIHGDADRNVPYRGSVIRQLPAIEQWAAVQATERLCNPTPHIISAKTITRFTWYDCGSNAPVQLVRIHGGVHGWIQMPDFTTDPNLIDPSTRDVIWNFFSSLQ